MEDVQSFDAESLISVYYGSQSGLSINADWSLVLDRSVQSIAPAGNVNGDGFDDFIIESSSSSSDVEPNITVYYGSASGPGNTADWTSVFKPYLRIKTRDINAQVFKSGSTFYW
jgi:hypothetical protein